MLDDLSFNGFLIIACISIFTLCYAWYNNKNQIIPDLNKSEFSKVDITKNEKTKKPKKNTKKVKKSEKPETEEKNELLVEESNAPAKILTKKEKKALAKIENEAVASANSKNSKKNEKAKPQNENQDNTTKMSKKEKKMNKIVNNQMAADNNWTTVDKEINQNSGNITSTANETAGNTKKQESQANKNKNTQKQAKSTGPAKGQLNDYLSQLPDEIKEQLKKQNGFIEKTDQTKQNKKINATVTEEWQNVKETATKQVRSKNQNFKNSESNNQESKQKVEVVSPVPVKNVPEEIKKVYCKTDGSYWTSMAEKRDLGKAINMTGLIDNSW